MIDLDALLADLAAESSELDRLVGALAEPDWRTPTPAPGWTIAHQISHLAWTDRMATLAATDPGAFAAVLAEAAGDPTGLVDREAAEGLAPAPELLDRWRRGRASLATALRETPPTEKIIWFGPPMSPAMTATGRLMETWAHGEDIADALGVTRRPTNRLRHVAYICVRTLGNGFAAAGRPVPTEPVRMELVAPDGTTWAYGPADAPDRLTGPALDFALLVTQRRHRDDLALTATGPVAREWLDVAQAFAGPPGAGRNPETGSGRNPETGTGRNPGAGRNPA
jgi:uncharacterized protein (TIGR03084 family)